MNCRPEKVAENKAKEFPRPPVEIKQTCGGLLTLSTLLGPSEMEKSSETINHMAGKIISSQKVHTEARYYQYNQYLQK